MLSQRLGKQLRCARTVASEIITALSDIMLEEIYLGNDISLGALGSLKLREIKKRNGVNPSTGERIIIPASLRVKLNESKLLRKVLSDRLNKQKRSH